MKQLTILYSLVILFILSACSSKDEPAYPVYMQPSSIQSADIDANFTETFFTNSVISNPITYTVNWTEK